MEEAAKARVEAPEVASRVVAEEAAVARSVGATAAATWEQNARGTPRVKKNGWVTGYLARQNRV